MYNTLIKHNENYLLIPFGLYNNNIICYFNSLLQSLYSCTSINEYLLNNENKFKNNRFMIIYISIIKNHIMIEKAKDNNYNTEQNNLILFNEFLMLVRGKNANFGYNQEDSGELLLLLLDIIDDKYIYNMFYNKYKCIIYCKQCKFIHNIPDDISVQFEIDVNTVNNKFLRSEIDKNLHNLNKYIRNNYSNCDNYVCKNCKKNNTSIKINRLILIPTIIVVNLNKYVEKINYNYPSEIFFINKDECKKYNYKLISTICHSGNTNFGHYVSNSIRKHVKNNEIATSVFELNDSSYKIHNFKPNDNSYILFYHYVNSVDYFI